MVAMDSKRWVSVFCHVFSESGLTCFEKFFGGTEKTNLCWRIEWFSFWAIFQQRTAEYLQYKVSFLSKQTHNSGYSYASIADLFIAFKQFQLQNQPTHSALHVCKEFLNIGLQFQSAKKF
jgi:hypothetical protein